MLEVLSAPSMICHLRGLRKETEMYCCSSAADMESRVEAHISGRSTLSFAIDSLLSVHLRLLHTVAGNGQIW